MPVFLNHRKFLTFTFSNACSWLPHIRFGHHGYNITISFEFENDFAMIAEVSVGFSSFAPVFVTTATRRRCHFNVNSSDQKNIFTVTSSLYDMTHLLTWRGRLTCAATSHQRVIAKSGFTFKGVLMLLRVLNISKVDSKVQNGEHADVAFESEGFLMIQSYCRLTQMTLSGVYCPSLSRAQHTI